MPSTSSEQGYDEDDDNLFPAYFVEAVYVTVDYQR